MCVCLCQDQTEDSGEDPTAHGQVARPCVCHLGSVMTTLTVPAPALGLKCLGGRNMHGSANTYSVLKVRTALQVCPCRKVNIILKSKFSYHLN